MLELTIDEPDRLIKVAHALSSEIRINILKLLSNQNENIVDIADKLNLPVSTVASNVKVMEDAGIIVTEIRRASRGTMKVCARTFDDIHMNLNVNVGYNNPNCYQIDMPVGFYTDCDIHPTCGMINQNGVCKPDDEPSIFFHPNRMSAQMIWFRRGFVEYRFPTLTVPNAKVQSIQFSMELCSEAPRYDHNWPSDITAWINGVEIGTWTCPGDFGDRRGRLNPAWFPDQHTQYGLLKTWKVDATGSYLDDVKISEINLRDIQLGDHQAIRFRVGNMPHAEHMGGINLFGKELGDHDQDIVMRIIYT
ncbi:transcriptional regulator [Paenibacillus sp. 32352]|uniref:ArsR/SmtB family transcription factor n=1 Tax=Paenibacillus sp. 32352 TaxID=1969111 RepID=UPI0009AD6E61|nr:winged helix-turn-helix transcriptional regulator [Paenibacillus sp. 32352]